MITSTNNIRGQKAPYEFYGLSTDEKPIEHFEGVKIVNGSLFYEIDTKNIYMFDEENKIWICQ